MSSVKPEGGFNTTGQPQIAEGEKRKRTTHQHRLEAVTNRCDEERKEERKTRRKERLSVHLRRFPLQMSSLVWNSGGKNEKKFISNQPE